METRKHAILPPSAAHRWLNCHAAPALESRLEDRSTTFAVEGSLAHALCAKGLKRLLHADTVAEDKEIKELSKETPVTAEMVEHTQIYIDMVWAQYLTVLRTCPDAVLLVEKRVAPTSYVADCYGTSDAIIAADNILHIYDFKYGKGVRVDAVYNPQLMIYALGAIEELYPDFAFEDCTLHIVQPRLCNTSDWHITAEALISWGNDTLAPAAAACATGYAEANPGEWCRFCRVKADCAALARYGMAAAMNRRDARLLTPQEKADALAAAATVKNWIGALEESALADALGGTVIPGYKLVEGRSVRKIARPTEAAAALRAAGVKRSLYMKPAQMKGLTDIEAAIGRAAATKIIGDFIEKPAGKPALVPASDKRPEFNSAQSDFSGIEI